MLLVLPNFIKSGEKRESLIVPRCHFCLSSERRRKKFVGHANQPFFVCLDCIKNFGGEPAIIQTIDKIHFDQKTLFPNARPCIPAKVSCPVPAGYPAKPESEESK